MEAEYPDLVFPFPSTAANSRHMTPLERLNNHNPHCKQCNTITPQGIDGQGKKNFGRCLTSVRPVESLVFRWSFTDGLDLRCFKALLATAQEGVGWSGISE